MAVYIFSDAHLGAGSPEEEQNKIEKIELFFEKVRQDGERLIILGDLFDFWFEYKHAIVKDQFHMLYLLHELSNSGIQIDYISGNHDFWMDDYFEKQIGVNLHRDSLDIDHYGKRVHLIHGDGLAPADVGYRFLKRILRNRFNIWLYQKLPPDWAIPLAKKVSSSSRKHTSKRDMKFANDYKTYAARKLSDGYGIVIIGHLHLPICEQLENGLYINSGDFISHFSYVRLDSSDASLLRID